MNNGNIVDKYDKPFPKRLRDLLKNNDNCSPLKRVVSQNELSKILGITRQAINAYTLGETLPRLEEFQKIADFFHVSLDYLAGKSDFESLSDQKVHEMTGLSHKAIENIQSFTNIITRHIEFFDDVYHHHIATLNMIIENDEFKEIINNFTDVLVQSWKAEYLYKESYTESEKIKLEQLLKYDIVSTTNILANIINNIKDNCLNEYMELSDSKNFFKAEDCIAKKVTEDLENGNSNKEK